MGKFFLRKSNPVFYHIHSSGRAITPASSMKEISGRDLCSITEGVLGPLSDRRGFNRESEIDRCIFELNAIQFEKLLVGARDIVRSQYFSNGKMPYEIDMVSVGGKKEMVVRLSPLLSQATKEKLMELSSFASLAGFLFEASLNGNGEKFSVIIPVSKNRRQ
ncbi:Uncharacterised protein [uncultured archaeon]|nr:Uncharacterised protein [uncultured archaeon]